MCEYWTKNNFLNRIKRFHHILLKNSTSDTEDLSAFLYLLLQDKGGKYPKANV